MHEEKILVITPRIPLALFSFSLLKVGIPPMKSMVFNVSNTVSWQHGSSGIWNVEKYWFSGGEFSLPQAFHSKYTPRHKPWTLPIFHNKICIKTLVRALAEGVYRRSQFSYSRFTSCWCFEVYFWSRDRFKNCQRSTGILMELVSGRVWQGQVAAVCRPLSRPEAPTLSCISVDKIMNSLFLENSSLYM